MDAPFTLARLEQEVRPFLSANDLEGAEEVLNSALSSHPSQAALIHLQYAKVYRLFNLLTSATHHLYRAIESAGVLNEANHFLRDQAVAELGELRDQQLRQRP